MKILAVSDAEVDLIYSSAIVSYFKDIDMLISCGDLSYYYLEFMISMLNKPMYYVRGNHCSKLESGAGEGRYEPWGAIDLHERSVRHPSGLMMAGIQGCMRYNRGAFQYTPSEMWLMVFNLVPKLMINRLLYGRYLDIFVSHAPQSGIHDQDDLPHRGIKAFNWLVRVFKPLMHLHGHIHVYRQDTITETLLYNRTSVINTYRYRVITLDNNLLKARA